MVRIITEKEKDIIINCGAFKFQPQKIATVLNWPPDEVSQLYNNKGTEFFKLIKKGRDTADYILTLKLFEQAQTGDLKALEEFENRRNDYEE